MSLKGLRSPRVTLLLPLKPVSRVFPNRFWKDDPPRWMAEGHDKHVAVSST